MSKRVLVIGGAGYIGGHTVDVLLNQGHKVTVYDNLTYENRFLKNVNFVYGDVRDTDKVIETAKTFDVVVLMAALVGDPACSVDDVLTNEINHVAIANICTRLPQEKHVIFMSTCHDEETLCYTNNGIKKYGDINLNDKVLSINVETNDIEWKPIKRIIVKNYDGDLINIEGRRTSFNLTPDHNMLLIQNKKNIYKRAIDIKDKALTKFVTTGKWNGKSSYNFYFNDNNDKDNVPNEIQLNDSLKALMPLTVFTDSSTTLPKPPKDIETLNPFKPGDFVMTAEDRYSRLAITTILWNIYRHFAIGVNDNTDWDNILFKALSSATQNNNENQFIRTLNIMSASVNDGQSRVWSRESEFIYGLPIIWKYIGDKLVISKTFDKSSKIKIGSEIISINDISLNQLISKEMLAISANTEEWKKLRAASALKAGPYNQSVKLKVLSPEGIEEEHIIYKNTPLVDMIEDKPPYFEILDENQYYFDLTRLTDRGFKNIINDMKDKIASAKHIIFDLRGLSSMSTDFLGLFMELGVTAVSREIPVFSKPGGKPCTYYKINEEITAKNPKINASLFFLIDERTTGNAEIIAAFAKHYDIGKLIGSKTSGNADEVIGIKLPGEFAASIVGMKTTILGSNLVLKNGIKPDVNVNISVKGIAEGKDEVLEAAFKLLKK